MANHTLTVPVPLGDADELAIDRAAVFGSFDIEAAAGDTLTLVFDVTPWPTWRPEPRRRSLRAMMVDFQMESWRVSPVPVWPGPGGAEVSDGERSWSRINSYLEVPFSPHDYRADRYLARSLRAGEVEAVDSTGGSWTPPRVAWDTRGTWGGRVALNEDGTLTCVTAITGKFHIAAIFESHVDVPAVATWRPLAS